MQTKMIPGLLALLCSVPAFSATEGPLIVKNNYTGFTSVDWIRHETCELYSDRVVITKGFGATNTIAETRPLQVSGDIQSLATRAKEEALTEVPNYLCDGPSTVTEVTRSSPNEADEKVLLFSTGGCGTALVKRDGPAASMLRDMIDSFCPKTVEAQPQ